MAETKKDNIYIDVDDEITAIIDKVRASEAGIVALVLPKRATVLQSVVNMKLLKRSAEEDSKKLVLITSEKSLLPLAGASGVYVAKDLQSRPAIPSAPEEVSDSLGDDDALDLADEPEEETYTADTAGERPVGDLAGAGMTKSERDLAEAQSNYKPEAAVASGAAAGAAAKAAKPKKNRKLKVPNFSKFRLRMILAALAALLLLVALFLLFFVLPKATIAINTDGRSINSSIEVTLDSLAEQVDPASGIVPATVVSEEKTYSEQVEATGEENFGNTATGSVDMIACTSDGFDSPDDVPAGTGVSTNGLTYITQEETDFRFSHPDNSRNCYVWQADDIDITAQNAGEDYNVDNANFSVAGRSDVSATGSASGGTTDIRQVVTQADIDNARGKIEAQDSEVQAELREQLEQNNLYPILATFTASDPEVTTSAEPGEEASSVTVTQTTTYVMYGTNRNNLVALIKQDIGDQANLDQQAILDDGLNNASFSLEEFTETAAIVNMENTAQVGPEISITNLKEQIGGEKAGFARETIQRIPGVTDVTIDMRPFWLSSIPDDPEKIDIQIRGSNSGS